MSRDAWLWGLGVVGLVGVIAVASQRRPTQRHPQPSPPQPGPPQPPPPQPSPPQPGPPQPQSPLPQPGPTFTIPAYTRDSNSWRGWSQVQNVVFDPVLQGAGNGMAGIVGTVADFFAKYGPPTAYWFRDTYTIPASNYWEWTHVPNPAPGGIGNLRAWATQAPANA